MSYLSTVTDKATELLARSGFSSLPASTQRLILAALPASVVASLIPAAYKDYQSFLALGPGGPPYNAIGWLVVRLFFNPLGREMFATRMYEKKIEKGDEVSYLADLPRRKAARPTMGSMAPPQRQVDQIPTEEVKEKAKAAYDAFLDNNSHIVERQLSPLERNTDAALVCKHIPLTPAAKEMKREICHLHGTHDFSSHVTLSPADCKKVIELGWAQRFPFAGSTIFKNITFGRLAVIPEEYLFVYAPRDEEEIEIVMRIMQASVRYVAGVEDVRL
ncbi:hypothetical protein BDV19DRAFT_371195 [Aspergillus venezuelensis]